MGLQSREKHDFQVQVFKLPEEQHEIDDANKGSLEAHHHISKSRNNPLNVYTFVLTNPDDPAKKVSASRYSVPIS